MQEDYRPNYLSRRLFLTGSAALLAACRSSTSSGSSTTVFQPATSLASVTSSDPGSTSPDGGLRLLIPPGSIRNDVFERVSSEFGVPVVVEVYADPAFVIDRLLSQQGEQQYDVIVVPGAFLPAAIAQHLLLRIDKTLVPSVAGQVAGVRASPFDPDSVYSICKEVGYTGYAWDRTLVPDGIDSWEQFLEVAARADISGKVTALAEGAELLAISDWSHGRRTPTNFDTAAATADLRVRLLPHLLDLDSGPSVRMLEGSVALAQMWNGEGRRLVLSEPERWGYAIGGPVTGVWMERYVVPASAPSPELAHRFIELMLDPDVSSAEVGGRGYNSGLEAIQQQIASLDGGKFIPVGDAMFGDSKDYGAALLGTSPEGLRSLVVGVIQELAGTGAGVDPTTSTSVAPSTSTAPSTAAPATSIDATTVPLDAPATTAVQFDDKGRPMLRPQDSGAGVEKLQHRLVDLGYSIGRVDGSFGDVTLAAVMSFQRSQGLQTDGVVGRHTWDALENPVPIVSHDVNTRGVASNAPSDASGHAPAGGGPDGRTWVKAIIYLDSFRDEFFDASGTLVGSFPNSPGVNGLTPTGTFKVYSRSASTFYSKNPAETMKWMVRFNGGVGFHSVPRIDGVPQPTPLGVAPSSHGCIRHADDVAKKIFDNLADGATIVVRHG